ncbi:MAG: Brp/Blh family beta-carotene 15,15'-dioxygenase [Epibacterium sp.]|nr:Brp/Blh family beta-carotene 15,15'-dioxygenase [Epibacterium sp.]
MEGAVMDLRRVQLLFMAVGSTVSVSYNILFSDTSLSSMLVVLGIGICIIGLPHGAIDGYLAQRAGFSKDIKSFFLFNILYISISGLVVGAWFFVPDITFVFFLIITAWHFGADGAAQTPFERCLFGLLVLTLPSLFHPELTTTLFELLEVGNASIFAEWMQLLAPAAFIAFMASLFWRRGNGKRSIFCPLVALSLVAFSYALPPLLFFFIYFCFLHSPNHFKRVLLEVPNRDFRGFFYTTALYTVLAIFFACVGYFMLIPFVVFNQAVVLVIFVGLAALTVPHMILVDGFWRTHVDRANLLTKRK